MFDISITSLPTPQQHCWLHQKTLDHPHSSQILLHFGSLRRCCHIPVIKSHGLHRFQRVSQCSTFHHPTKKLVNYWKPILLASLAKRSGMLPLERKSSSCSKDVESSNSPEAHGERSMLWIADWDGWVENDVDTSHFPAVFLAAQWRWWRPGSVHLWSDYQSGGKPVLTLGEAKICKWKSICAHEICVPAAGVPPAEHENAKTRKRQARKREKTKTRKRRKRENGENTIHSVVLWTRTLSQIWACVGMYASNPFRILRTQTLSQLWACVKYAPKQPSP